MKISVKLLAAALFFAGIATYASADVTWTLSDVYFSNGNEATGSFTINDAFTVIESASFVVTGTDLSSTFTVMSLDLADLPGAIGFGIFPQYVNLVAAADLTSAGGTISLIPAMGASVNCPGPPAEGCGLLLSGNGYTPEIIGFVTPEPLSLLLFGTGLMAIMGIAHRKLPGRSPRVSSNIWNLRLRTKPLQ
jgi:hypothetical protein